MPTSARWPISLWQQFVLLMDRGRPGFAIDPWFTLDAVVRLEGPLRWETLAAAFADLVAAHDALRTRVSADGPEPAQLVCDRADTELELVDESEVLVDGTLVHVPIALERLSPIRLRLASRSPVEHLLALHIHHLIADPTTLWCALRDLAARYSAMLGGPPPRPPTAQYGEFAVAQAELVRTDHLSAQRWWRDATVGMRPRTVRRTPTTGSSHRRGVLLTTGELAGVRHWSRRNRSTQFVTMLAALACAVAPCYDSSGPLLFSSMFSRRDDPRWQRMLGAGTLNVYLPVPEPPRTLSAAYVTRVRDCVLGAYRHSRFPLVEVENLAGIPGHGSRGESYTVPFFEYLPLAWPTGVRFGPATGHVIASAAGQDGGEKRSLAIRVRADATGTLVGRSSWDGLDWTELHALRVCDEFRAQLTALTGRDLMPVDGGGG